DIQTLQNALAKVLSLRGVSYNWKDPEKDSNTQLGLIAQEVEKIYPELVKTDNEGNKHLRYTGLIAPLIEALKELSDENAALRTELESLTENQEGLKAEVELIKEQLLMQGKAK
ncbi:MAG: tail fiber domain-containing protein, partial [Chitinophagales bacterium]